jgi:hypothetical protein
MAEALSPFLHPSFSFRDVRLTRADPVGSMTWCVSYGAKPSKTAFAAYVGDLPLVRWSRLRNGWPLLLDDSENDVFNALERSRRVQLWQWASSELPHQHPVTGDTVFHLLCRTNALPLTGRMQVLADLKAHHRNPLTPNYRNELCIEFTSDAELRKSLQEYMCWQPDKRVMEWFGPFFQRRAWALLLVRNRLKA